MRRGLLTLGVAIGVLWSPAASGAAFDPAAELANYNKQNERAQYDYEDPARLYETNVSRAGGFVEVAGLVLQDPERTPITTCAARYSLCAGDTRVYDWGERYGLAYPVRFVNRHGATLSGTLWAPFGRDGVAPGRLPAIVITTGGAQAPETIYWTQAQALARRGYLVLTWESQGQGRSDTFGFGGDRLGGVPSEDYRNFRDGLVDALDFLYSDPCAPYAPRGEDGARRQRERAAAGTAAAHNPLHALMDHRGCGVAGHSFGAVAASEVAATDSRVATVVAWDWLARDVCDAYETGDQDFCVGGPRRPVPPRVPGLNIAADYGFDAAPNTSEPDPGKRSRAFEEFRDRGLDTMSVIVRGGGHYECPYIPNELLGATLRGIDLCAWYTTAWFDKQLRGDPTADARLLSDRWRADRRGAEVDAGGDGNLLSFYHPSRAALRLAGGGRFVCDDLRAGCAGQVAAAADGFAGDYAVLADRAQAATAGPVPGATAGACAEAAAPAQGALGLPRRACRSRRRFTIRVRRPRGVRLRSATIVVDGRRVRTLRGRRLRARVNLRGLPRGRYRVSIVAVTTAGRVLAETRTYRTCA